MRPLCDLGCKYDGPYRTDDDCDGRRAGRCYATARDAARLVAPVQGGIREPFFFSPSGNSPLPTFATLDRKLRQLAIHPAANRNLLLQTGPTVGCIEEDSPSSDVQCNEVDSPRSEDSYGPVCPPI